MSGALNGVPAYLLHRYPYRDSSLVVEWFTPEHGRVAAVARGARRASSAFGQLQPWRVFQITWRGRGDLATLVQAEESGAPLHMPQLATLCGFYLNELLMRLLARWDPHPQLFEDYQNTLAALPGEDAPDWLLRCFEWRLLSALGFAPDLQHCKGCDKAVDVHAEQWFYAPGNGIFCVAHADLASSIPVTTQALFCLAQGVDCPDPVQRLALRKCLSQDLAVHLDGKALQSRVLLRDYWRHRIQNSELSDQNSKNPAAMPYKLLTSDF